MWPAYEDGTDRVPKRRHINSRRRVITQKKAYNIQNTAKAWNQEVWFCFPHVGLTCQEMHVSRIGMPSTSAQKWWFILYDAVVMSLKCWWKLKCHVQLPWSSPVADFVRNLWAVLQLCADGRVAVVIVSHQGREEHAQTGLIATAGGYCIYIHVCRKNKQLGAVLGFTELARRTYVLILRVTVLHYYLYSFTYLY